MRTTWAEASADTVRRLARETSGQDLLEYGLLASLIATFVVGAVSLLGERMNTLLWAPIARMF